MAIQVVLVSFKGVVKGQTQLASSGLLPLLAKFLFPYWINFGGCFVHDNSCAMHSAFAHLPSSFFQPISLSPCFSDNLITRSPDLLIYYPLPPDFQPISPHLHTTTS